MYAYTPTKNSKCQYCSPTHYLLIRICSEHRPEHFRAKCLPLSLSLCLCTVDSRKCKESRLAPSTKRKTLYRPTNSVSCLPGW